MTQALQPTSPPELVPVKITLEQYHRMVDVGIWDDRHVEFSLVAQSQSQTLLLCSD
jgi:hypothetical protein